MTIFELAYLVAANNQGTLDGELRPLVALPGQSCVLLTRCFA